MMGDWVILGMVNTRYAALQKFQNIPGNLLRSLCFLNKILTFDVSNE
jgi:hypothetical protein